MITSNQQTKDDFVFTVVEDDCENVTIGVSEEDYQRERTAGVEVESLLKRGRYKLKRGGFIARHPELRLTEKEKV